MLMSDLAQFLEEIVEPTITDFEKNPTSRRHAFLACVAACHGVDYLAYPDDPRTLRQQFEHQSREFKIVNDVGHAFKHVVQGRPTAPRMKASQVVQRPPGALDVAVFDVSRFDGAAGGVTLDTDTRVDLLSAVKEATAFLWSQIKGERAPSAQ
jgi:hypothetical protein